VLAFIFLNTRTSDANKIKKQVFAMLLTAIILLLVVQRSYQVVYPCDPTVVCGCSSNPASVTRIVGGETASEATWGWAVSISLDASELCGGSILSSSWIITAAHCANDYTPSQVIVYAGSTLRWIGTQSRSVSRIIIHPNYNSVSYTNDIALLQLASPLTMSDPNVSPICVPSVSSTTLSAGEWPVAGTVVSVVSFLKVSLNLC
jgi:secreted trypsin-like serine protease